MFAIICTAILKKETLSDEPPPPSITISENYKFAEQNETLDPISTDINIIGQTQHRTNTIPKPKIATETMQHLYEYTGDNTEETAHESSASAAVSPEGITTPAPVIVQHGNYTDYRDKVKKYQESLPDVYGYLDIPNTRVSYPVMLPPLDKAYDYYLSKDIYGNYEYAGSIFLDQYSGIKPSNEGEHAILQIYGHNMANGSMFAGLNKFKEASFTNSHPYFSFSTADTAYSCTIIATIQVDDTKALDVYRYDYPWQTADQLADGWNKLLGEEKFSAKDIKAKMDSGIEYMLLHTCSTYVYGKKVENGRFLVLAECLPN